MAVTKTWAVALIVVAAYLALCSEMDYRGAKIERCSVVHCS